MISSAYGAHDIKQDYVVYVDSFNSLPPTPPTVDEFTVKPLCI